MRPSALNVRNRDRLAAGAAGAFLFVWCFVLERLLQHLPFDLDLFRPALLGQAFNSMAEHLAAGRFDVDPDAIDFEAFIVDDRTVSYFGVFCALLRLPLLPFPGLAHLDITRLSCLAAVSMGAWFQVRAVLLVRGSVPAGPRRDWLTAALLVCILLGGQQIQFLRPSIYQEVVNWAGALAMGFVTLALRGLLTDRGFDWRTLTGMATFAGLALLDRVSIGVGLYAALGGLLLLQWRRPVRAVVPGLLLLGFAAAVGVVNYGRWGNPLEFADFTVYSLSQDVAPDRLGRLSAYGAFNWRRIGITLSYYFLPIWGLVRPDGQLLFAEAQVAMIDAIELPAGSFFVSDPLLVGLAAAFFITPSSPTMTSGARWPARALLAGLAIPPALMLCAISMAHRYRMEFYPFLVLAALLGFHALCRPGAPRFGRAARAAIVAAVVVSVVVSHGMAALYVVSPWGPAEQYITKDGWIGTYAPRLRAGHD